MKTDKSTIKYKLDRIQRDQKIIEKIGKFLKTKRGVQFVKGLHRMPLRDLCKRHNAQFMLIYDSDTKNLNIIKSSIRKYNIVQDSPKPRVVEETSIPRIAYPTRLTKPQMKEMQARLKPKKFGFAALMHAYEEQKMNKFKKKHPAPTERELAEDLFPEELVKGYERMLDIHREYVRNFLCRVYAKTEKRERYFRVFKVLSITTDPATGKTHKPVISEVELDRPFLGNRYTSKKDIALRLKMIANSVRDGDKNVIKVKLYNKYGVLIRTVNYPHKNTSESLAA